MKKKLFKCWNLFKGGTPYISHIYGNVWYGFQVVWSGIGYFGQEWNMIYWGSDQCTVIHEDRTPNHNPSKSHK